MANDPTSGPPPQYPTPPAWQAPPGYPYSWPMQPMPVAQAVQAHPTETERMMLDQLKTLAGKVDDIASDRVRRTDLDTLRREIAEQFAKGEVRTYSRPETDAKIAALEVANKTLADTLAELKATVGTQAERQLARWGTYIAIGVGAFTLAKQLHLIP